MDNTPHHVSDCSSKHSSYSYHGSRSNVHYVSYYYSDHVSDYDSNYYSDNSDDQEHQDEHHYEVVYARISQLGVRELVKNETFKVSPLPSI